MNTNLRLSLIESFEPLLLMSATMIEGTDMGEWISGDHNDNEIFAGGGDDAIHAPLGNNTIDGGAGDDTLVIYEGVQADYHLSDLADGSVVLKGPGLNGSEVRNTLFNVEKILFNDGELLLDNDPEPALAEQPIESGSAEAPSESPDGAAQAGDLTNTNEVPVGTIPPLIADIVGTDDGEWISATKSDDVIDARGGDDNIHAPIGHNVIDGSTGVDTLIVYEGVRANFSVELQDNGTVRVTGPGLNGKESVNELRNFEQIQFNDQILQLNSTPNRQDDSPSADVEVFDQLSEQPVETPPTDDTKISSGNEAEPASGFDGNSLSDFLADENEFITQVVTLTNQIRSEYGIAPLTVNLELQVAAQTHVENMAFQDFFSHTGLDGLQPWDRAETAGYDYQTMGENIAAGQRTPAEVVQAWVDSPGHLANILNPRFTEIGVGYEYLENDTGVVNYNHYWGQEFGTER